MAGQHNILAALADRHDHVGAGPGPGALIAALEGHDLRSETLRAQLGDKHVATLVIGLAGIGLNRRLDRLPLGRKRWRDNGRILRRGQQGKCEKRLDQHGGPLPKVRPLLAAQLFSRQPDRNTAQQAMDRTRVSPALIATPIQMLLSAWPMKPKRKPSIM